MIYALRRWWAYWWHYVDLDRDEAARAAAMQLERTRRSFQSLSPSIQQMMIDIAVRNLLNKTIFNRNWRGPHGDR